jgi:hypothetical protein
MKRRRRQSQDARFWRLKVPRAAVPLLGLELLGKQRKEFARGKGPPRAERVGASESLVSGG